MVNDADKFKAEDEKQKERITAKNGLESYCFNMKSTMNDEKLKDKISEDEKQAISSKCDEAVKWLDNNQLPRWTSSRTSRRRWRQSATPLSQSFTSKMKRLVLACLVVCREGCLMGCLTVCLEGCQEGCQVGCLEGCPMEKPAVPAVQDPQLKKSTKLDLFKSRIFCNMCIYLGCISCS